ncbi:MAG: ankyrin repeat domain-containing protein [Proteobacteria bacterium]|nr:ankyrin repeat domain-containing protein [Pseudomonadota bacterium]
MRKGLVLIAVLLLAFGAYHYWTTRLGGHIPLPWTDRPIIAAVKACDSARTARFLRSDPRGVRYRIKKSRATALHWAARKCAPSVVGLLLGQGASLTARDRRGATPLHWAAAHGRPETVRLLLDRGSRVNARDYRGSTPLHRAARRGDPAVVSLLLRRGAHKYALDRRGRSPLVWAKMNHRDQVVRLLEGRPTAPKPVPRPAKTPPVTPAPAKPALKRPVPPPVAGGGIIAAIKRGDLKAVEKILQSNPAAVRSTDPRQRATALHWAARAGKKDMVLLLLFRYNADPRARDKHGRTPFDWAKKANQEDIAALLKPSR